MVGKKETTKFYLLLCSNEIRSNRANCVFLAELLICVLKRQSTINTLPQEKKNKHLLKPKCSQTSVTG